MVNLFKYLFFYKFNCTDPGLQLGDLAPFIGLLLWTCRHFIYHGQNTRDKSKRNRLLGIEVRNAPACVAGVERGRGWGGRGKGDFLPLPSHFGPAKQARNARDQEPMGSWRD